MTKEDKTTQVQKACYLGLKIRKAEQAIRTESVLRESKGIADAAKTHGVSCTYIKRILDGKR